MPIRGETEGRWSAFSVSNKIVVLCRCAWFRVRAIIAEDSWKHRPKSITIRPKCPPCIRYVRARMADSIEGAVINGKLCRGMPLAWRSRGNGSPCCALIQTTGCPFANPSRISVVAHVNLAPPPNGADSSTILPARAFRSHLAHDESATGSRSPRKIDEPRFERASICVL